MVPFTLITPMKGSSAEERIWLLQRKDVRLRVSPMMRNSQVARYRLKLLFFLLKFAARWNVEKNHGCKALSVAAFQ